MSRPRYALAVLGLVGALSSSPGCQMGYYIHNAYHQTKIVNSRQRIERSLGESTVTPEQKRKLKLVQEVKQFAETELGLKPSRNYTTYVDLQRPYVTYIVQAAKAWELKPHLWKFPFVGAVPYKGYFTKAGAEAEAKRFPPAEYDTFIRGVTAYSTLGWFQDSVLSTMLRYEDQDLVELIVHETVHTTLFIKDAVDFNERMATFLGQVGMRQFFDKRGGDNAKFIVAAEQQLADQKIFSKFISKEIADLKSWYEDNSQNLNSEAKAQRLEAIRKRFANTVKAKLQSKSYSGFESQTLNNAYLLGLQTYEHDLQDFFSLYEYHRGDFKKTLEYLKSLESTKKPDQALKDFVASLAATK